VELLGARGGAPGAANARPAAPPRHRNGVGYEEAGVVVKSEAGAKSVSTCAGYLLRKSLKSSSIWPHGSLRLSCSSLPCRGIPLGTSVHKIRGLSQYNGSHLPSCFYEKMHVSGNSRTGKLMLNENTCTYTSTKQRGNLCSSSVEGHAKTPSYVDTTILFRRMGFISPL
jgi:hypothetical protein